VRILTEQAGNVYLFVQNFLGLWREGTLCLWFLILHFNNQYKLPAKQCVMETLIQSAVRGELVES
jgi:hypothetical protein